MINTLLGKVFGTKNEREVKRLLPNVEAINGLEQQMQKLSDEELRAKTDEFRRRIQERVAEIPDEPGAESDRRKELEDERYKTISEVLTDILVEAFAVVREASRRVLNMRHFDVQLIGGMVLHDGKIAEMKTGEGKTLVATLPVYLNALQRTRRARRHGQRLPGQARLGVDGQALPLPGTVGGVIVHDLDDEQRKEAYAADVTYGTNNEFGFDYLRDNMKFDLADCVQRGHNFAIVDEVDSILIDEARTPLIISGASEESTDKYAQVNTIIPKLEGRRNRSQRRASRRFSLAISWSTRSIETITVTDEGWEKVEELLGIGNIADPENWV